MKNKPQVIAFYLPQFHNVKENNEWWGEGFTDWVNTKKTMPFILGQVQPRIPLYENYYDLLEKKTMRWQEKLLHTYGIDGLCIYHYWFEGRMILEKPAENLLNWTDVDIPFCFSWANETWKHSWGKAKGNAWNPVGDKEKINHTDGILLEQTYGNEEDWRRHFEYLYPFFMDKRYIKKDSRPVFLLYKPAEIPCLKEMILFWNRLAREKNMKEIYWIATNVPPDNIKVKSIINAEMMYEPQYTKFYDKPVQYKKRDEVIWWLQNRGVKLPAIYSYKAFWKRIVKRMPNAGKKKYMGCFVDYDNTPRYGKNADVFLGGSPREFGKKFRVLYEKAIKQKQEFLFVTAWNEWGEGAYLEPDEQYRYAYLEEIRQCVGMKKEENV